ncbi:alpha/beta fold hydrolase [Pseudomonas typographi]|uniref:Alpha/beta fold hydrolase n=1 Tax=Pseudomonas typographi TaxID=2715964 RepID=A0ABR7YYY8_9PSED|nr:alpha/beta fold hydrolase [Pseudomonas typographi]MBD1598382.1 alpha/beta fold hydrolase [Pseudomonas typographi]
MISEPSRFELGDLPLQNGATLLDAQLAYTCTGTLNAAGDNAVLLPSYYTGNHGSYRAWIGPGRPLDTARHFIIAVNQFGNGVSTSPSNSTRQAGAAFPLLELADNVEAQARLLAHLGVSSLALVAGWSMGAMQAFEWAVRYPDSVRAVLAVCGTARCWPLNQVFLDGVRAALQADGDYLAGRYAQPPLRGLRAFGRAYAGWAYSAEFFREGLYRTLGFADLEALLRDWEEDHCQHDANDLLAVLHAWQRADPSRAHHGLRLSEALATIQARCILMPSSTDAYFTLEEARIEYNALRHAQWRPLKSPYGHCAGAPGRFAAESLHIDQALRDLLG